MAEATYELRLRGAVSRLALSIFEELELQSDTVVSGVIQDQAALHGLLERIRDLGLELVDVHRITVPGSIFDPEAAPAYVVAEPSQRSEQAP